MQRQSGDDPEFSDVRIGGVLGASPDGASWKVAVTVLGEVNYGYEPRVQVAVGPRRRATCKAGDGRYLHSGDDWWFLLDAEVEALSGWLVAADLAAATGQTGEVGAVSGLHPSWEHWLSVGVVPAVLAASARRGALLVQVRFDDQMLRDEGRQNVVELSGRSARTLARLLERALETAKRHPAKIRQPEAPPPGASL